MWRLRRSAQDEGFSLVEIIVAISVLAIAAVGVLPLVIGALRAGYSAKLHTQSKNLVQEQIDRMRNLPFHVAASNGPYLDLLDTYYPNIVAAAAPTGGTATAATVQTGYVSATAPRATGEPTGAFYRYVVPTDTAFKSFRTVVDSQFLDTNTTTGANTIFTPVSTYDSTSLAGQDAPQTRLLGVTVISSWNVASSLKTFRAYTEIADAKPAAPLINGSARSIAASIVATTTDGTKTSAAGGYLDASASVSTGSVGSARAIGAYVDRFPGSRLTGASQLADAPPDVSTPLAASDTLGNDLTPSTCSIACFGRNYVSGVAAVVAQGLPALGSSGTPIKAALQSNGGTAGVYVAAGVDGTMATNLMLRSGPTAIIRDFSGASDLAASTGYMTTTSGGSHYVNTHVTASVQSLAVMPTTFTPSGRGVVEVTLTSAVMDCKATNVSGGATASATYTATVQYWDGLQNRYVTLGTVKNGNTADPLPATSSLTVYSNGGTVLHLSDYISDWHSALNPTVNLGSDGGYARADLQSIVSITTVDLRPGDTASGLQAQVGAMSCTAEDQR